MIEENKNTLTDKEMLEALKKEIKRLSLEDSPSRTQLEKLYDNEKMPHPNSYVYRFDSWQNALKKIGIEYDGRKVQTGYVTEFNKGKRYASSWSDLTRDEVIDATLEEVSRIGARTSTEYQNKRDKENSPSITTLTYLYGFKWADVKNLYEAKYGQELKGYSEMGLSKGIWKDKSREELIDIATDEMIRIDARTYTDYTKDRDKKRTPSVSSMVNSGISWKEIKDNYNKKIEGEKQ